MEKKDDLCIKGDSITPFDRISMPFSWEKYMNNFKIKNMLKIVKTYAISFTIF
jgi:hypothetical protein